MPTCAGRVADRQLSSWTRATARSVCDLDSAARWGRPLTAQGFLGTFGRATAALGHHVFTNDRSAKFSMSSWQQFSVDISLIKYADDLNKFAVADLGSAVWDFSRELHWVDEALGDYLGRFG
eukprot:9180570-Pyramimonas_sp.AAC.1